MEPTHDPLNLDLLFKDSGFQNSGWLIIESFLLKMFSRLKIGAFLSLLMMLN